MLGLLAKRQELYFKTQGNKLELRFLGLSQETFASYLTSFDPVKLLAK